MKRKALISPLLHAEPKYPVQSHVYLTEEQVKLFQKAANKRGQTFSAFLRFSAELLAEETLEES